jgi:CubicO group peptidase (beta-lactamase class C family)
MGHGGLDDKAVQALVERIHREVDDGLLPSCQMALAKDGEIVELVTLGDATDDTRYVIFSCTKAIVASTVWQLLAEGAFRLEDKVADLIPEFGTNGKDVITVEQVLLHTSGFPHAPMGPPAWFSREGRLATFGEWRLNWEPGSQFEYHATSAHWVLAELIERHDGRDYREAIRARVLDPLGLPRLQLGVPAADTKDVAEIVHVGEAPSPDALEALIGVREFPVGEVTDEAVESFNEPDRLAVGVPGGGAVAGAADLALFYQGLLRNPGGLWDTHWLAEGTAHVRNTFAVPFIGVPANRTIGLVVAGEDGNAARRGMGHGQGPRTFGHDGAGGQIAWGDPDSGVSFVYLTNGHDRDLIRQWRRTTGISSRAAVVAEDAA